MYSEMAISRMINILYNIFFHLIAGRGGGGGRGGRISCKYSKDVIVSVVNIQALHLPHHDSINFCSDHAGKSGACSDSRHK